MKSSDYIWEMSVRELEEGVKKVRRALRPGTSLTTVPEAATQTRHNSPRLLGNPQSLGIREVPCVPGQSLSSICCPVAHGALGQLSLLQLKI